MTRDDAYEMAARMGFEGDVFFSEQDRGVGRVDHVRIELDEEGGTTSLWVAEVSEANGCEFFSAWDEDAERFFRECVAARKAKRRGNRVA